MNVAIIGCGKIGMRRAECFQKAGHHVAIFIDKDKAVAKAAGELYDSDHYACRWQNDLVMENIDIVCIATPHNLLAEIAVKMINAGKHVLIEKPGAINAKEFKKVVKASKKHPECVVYVGYNHRFHPALQKARSFCFNGDIGKITHIRAVYGHGGRLGYEKEWRADKKISGGGELLDQGSHLIDLVQWFIETASGAQCDTPELFLGHAALRTAYWKIDVEDNAFITLFTTKHQIIQLHASWTEWKNKFSFEIFGEHGKIEVTGLGGSYGPESVSLYEMGVSMEPPMCVKKTYPNIDVSWDEEVNHFLNLIYDRTEPNPIRSPVTKVQSLSEVKRTLQIIGGIYKKEQL